MRSLKRIMLVAADGNVPGPTYSGTSVIRWGLIAGLKACAVDVGYCAAGELKEGTPDEADLARMLGPGRFWRCGSDAGANGVADSTLRDALVAFDPDVVLVYGLKGISFMHGVEYGGPVGIMSVDLEYLPKLYWLSHFLRAGEVRQKLHAIRGFPNTIRRALRTRRLIFQEYPRADFVINHAAHHAKWHRRRHASKTLYTPNPVAEIYPTRPARIAAHPPRFMLLGGLSSISTLSGLEWFANRVYPLIEPDLADGRFEVHLVGRMQLATPLHRRMKLVVMRGYVERLDEEMQRTTAILVPTPIRLGFRTRILDAFRHGVTVVSHAANAVGMPELVHEQNALVTAKPREFAAAIRTLADDPQKAERLGQAAFDEFSSDLNAKSVARRIIRFIETEVVTDDE